MAKAHDIVISVLQNGREVCARRYSYGASRKIALSNHNVKKLFVDSYGIAHDLPVLMSSKTGVRILDVGKMSGYVVTGNSHMRLGQALDDQDFRLKPGDAASLSKMDLRILVKIAPRDRGGATAKRRPLNIPFFDMWIGSARNGKVLGFAALLTLIVLSGVVAGLLEKGDLRPKKLYQLDRAYLMPFIAAEHFRTLPEALQSNLDRNTPIFQLLSHYKAMTHVMLGYEESGGSTLDQETIATFRDRYSKRERALKQIETHNSHGIDAMLGKERWVGALSIPVVRGEAFVSSIRRSISSLRRYHLGLDANYSARKDFLGYAKENRIYQFAKNQSLHPLAKKPNLSGEPEGEELAMYQQYAALGQEASRRHLALKKVRTWEGVESVLKSHPVHIAPSAHNILLRRPQLAEGFDRKNLVISASAFDPRIALTAAGGKKFQAKKLILRGSIDPKTLRRAVRKRRFQLQICYENALRKNFRLKGQMEWEWVLDTRGKVSGLALVNSDIKDRQMIRCIKSRIAKWQLPKARNGKVKIRFPFTFDRAKG